MITTISFLYYLISNLPVITINLFINAGNYNTNNVNQTKKDLKYKPPKQRKG